MATKIEYRRTLYDEAWIRQRYCEEAQTAADIGIGIGCPTSTVLRAIRRLGIPVRHEAKPPETRVCPNEADPKCKKEFQVGGRGNRARSAIFCSRHCHMMHQSPRSTASLAPRPRKSAGTLHNEAWLRERYIDRKMSMGEIGVLCGCSAPSVKWALDKFGIEIRSQSLAMLGTKKRRGDNLDDGDNPKDKARRRGKDAARALKLEMVNAYGGQCNCCGELEIAFLCLDHINGGGIEDRTSAGGSQALYRKLRKAGWPKDNYRVLCANCNLGTKFGRTCPHQFKKGQQS